MPLNHCFGHEDGALDRDIFEAKIIRMLQKRLQGRNRILRAFFFD
jgi:hypothetical protein